MSTIYLKVVKKLEFFRTKPAQMCFAPVEIIDLNKLAEKKGGQARCSK